MVPAVVETVFHYPDGYGFANWMLIKNFFLVVFALIALTTGSYVSIVKIIESYT